MTGRRGDERDVAAGGAGSSSERRTGVSRSGARPPGSADRQRAAVYAAENQVARILDRAAEFPIVEVAGSRLAVPVERRFGDIAAVQRYVDAVLALPWVRARWPVSAGRAVTVRQRRGDSRAHYEADVAVIAVPVPAHGAGWALREMVVLHEVAHHLGRETDTGHGPAFVGRMVELVDGVIGAEAALLLRVALGDQGASAH